MLALAPLVDVLKEVALDLHVVVGAVALCPVALDLVDQAIQIVILGCRVVSRGPVWLLALHPALVVLYIQIELVRWVPAVSLGRSSDVSSHCVLADLLLEKLLVVLVLLRILLQ